MGWGPRENGDMAKAKNNEKSQSELLWEQYVAMQLTPEQKAEARREDLKLVEQARRDGVYQRVLEIVGTVKWSIPWQSLRSEE